MRDELQFMSSALQYEAWQIELQNPGYAHESHAFVSVSTKHREQKGNLENPGPSKSWGEQKLNLLPQFSCLPII